LGGAIEISLKVADFRNGSKAEVEPPMIEADIHQGDGLRQLCANGRHR
jgi:hypothetical protein